MSLLPRLFRGIVRSLRPPPAAVASPPAANVSAVASPPTAAVASPAAAAVDSPPAAAIAAPAAAAVAGGEWEQFATDLYDERSLPELVRKFKKYSENESFRKQGLIYGHVVRRLSVAKDFHSIKEILEVQKSYTSICNLGFNIRLILLYGRSGMFEEALQIFDEMPQRNIKHNVGTFNALLAACVCSRKFDQLEPLFRDLPARLGIKPDSVSYNTMIKALCMKGAPDSAAALLDRMETEGVEPNMVTFNTILNGFYTNGFFQKGESIWERMAERNLKPDIFSYNAKMLGLAKEKRTSDAVKLFKIMKKKGIKPDMFSYGALIRGFVKERNLRKAKRWYSAKEVGRLKPTFQALIPFACEKGDMLFAFEVSKDAIRSRCLVDGAVLQAVVDGLVKESRIKEARELVEQGNQHGYHRYNLKLSL